MSGTKIQTVRLNNGVEMPVLGLGVYQLHGEECERCICEAVELGYRLFDTAQMYGNEKAVGNGISQCGLPREELFITTKLYSPSRSYGLAKTAIKESLAALQTYYIDLLLIHEPYREAPDMYRAMEEALHAGLVRAIGISNFNKKQVRDFIRKVNIVPAVNQVESHVFYPQLELQELLEQQGIRMEAWSPFAAGKNRFFSDAVLCMLGDKYGKTAAQIGLRYLLQKGIIAIPKTSRKERMKENLSVFDFEISLTDMNRLESLNRGKSLFGWYS